MTREERDLARVSTMTSKRRALMAGFLAAFRTNANAAASARAIGVASRTVHEWRKQSQSRPEDPAFQVEFDGELVAFADAYAAARDECLDEIEGSLHRIATVGAVEPVMYRGVQVGEIRRVDVRAAEILLRRFRAADYRERHQMEVSGTVVHQHEFESARARLLDKLTLQLERQQGALPEAAPPLVIDVAPIHDPARPAPRSEDGDK